MGAMGLQILGIVLAAIASMILGMLWYGPIFGKQWMAAIGFSKADIKKAKSSGMGKTMTIAFITSIVTASMLMLILNMMGATSYSTAVAAGFYLWVGLLATKLLDSYLWEMKPFPLYLINATFSLINMIVMSLIVSIW